MYRYGFQGGALEREKPLSCSSDVPSRPGRDPSDATRGRCYAVDRPRSHAPRGNAYGRLETDGI